MSVTSTSGGQGMAWQDLEASVRDTLLARGFEIDWAVEIARQLDSLAAFPPDTKNIRDLRALPWISIDNSSSRDLDQVAYATRTQEGHYQLLSGIADVDFYVPRHSPIDRRASVNTVSVYAGIALFPMLPPPLSESLTSLLPDQERVAMVVDLRLDPEGNLLGSDVYQALVRNTAKLDYVTAGNWLEGRGELSPEQDTVAIQDQLALQATIARAIKAHRMQLGALVFERSEVELVVEGNRAVDLQAVVKNAAHELIENTMIQTNVAVARFLEAKGYASIRRVVRAPERWSRIVALAHSAGESLPPEANAAALASFLERRRLVDPHGFATLSFAVLKMMGAGEYQLEKPGDDSHNHFALAASDYAHSTAPNRRFSDLVTQRLLKAAIHGLPSPYNEMELLAIAQHCTEREDAAAKVERTVRKQAAALFFANRIGEEFEAVVTGKKNTNCYVRLLDPPLEARVRQGGEGIDVGDRGQVRLAAVDYRQGFIDVDWQTTVLRLG